MIRKAGYYLAWTWTAVLVAFTALCGGGCCSFSREWKEAGKVTPDSNELSGRWEGHWLSEANAHTGKLRCVVSQVKDGHFRARFHATYQKVLTFSYTAMLTADRSDSGFSFRGEADLGWLAGGVYTYDGKADATNFFSTYVCKYDHGTFQMQRR